MDTIDVSNLNRQFLFRYWSLTAYLTHSNKKNGILLRRYSCLYSKIVCIWDSLMVSCFHHWRKERSVCVGDTWAFLCICHHQPSLFRPKDVGRPKADVAAEFINNRVPGCNVVPYPSQNERLKQRAHTLWNLSVVPYCPHPVTIRRSRTLMSLSTGVSVCVTLAQQPRKRLRSFILFSPLHPPEFHIIVCGLDSIVARRWMNGMLVGMKKKKLNNHNKKTVITVDIYFFIWWTLSPLLDFSPELWRRSSRSELHHSSHWWRNGGLQRKRSCHSARHDCLYRLHTGALPTTGLSSRSHLSGLW